jgi:hypothetical protein
VPGGDQDLDHLGQRRLTPTETRWLYAAAFVSYVVLSIWQKFLLNWIVGPLWLVAFAWLGPYVIDAAKRARR